MEAVVLQVTQLVAKTSIGTSSVVRQHNRLVVAKAHAALQELFAANQMTRTISVVLDGSQ
jgi:3-methyladenine DNA glycosylase AlkC